MNPLVFLLLVITLVLAVGNWIAVYHRNRQLEYLCKPLTMISLIGVALAIEPHDSTARAWFVAALVFSLAGDVFLMLDHEPAERGDGPIHVGVSPRTEMGFFLPGLGAFLLAHLAYVGGMLADGVHGIGLLIGAIVVAVLVLLVGTQLVRAAQEAEPGLLLPVMAYTAVISAMVVAAVGVGRPLGIAGAGLFYASDAMIGWNRFVRPYSWFPVAIMVTYHLGQTGLVLSLI